MQVTLCRSMQSRGELVRLNDRKFPWTYHRKSLVEILAPLELTVDRGIAICDRYTNRSYFKTD